ncbi:MAG: carbon starvation CstA family protein [Planctomycetota bacterium]|jgi:carbon starvation protein
MECIVIMVVAFVGYLVAYNTYGRYLARKIFKLDPDRVTPSHEFQDGTDYVPTRKQVIFGHHFTSIAGTGPIVGPAIGIIWGWVPALIWVFLGAIFMGAVHDFGSLVLSLRNKGRSMADITGALMNRRLKIILFLIIFLGLLIVIAIFGLVIAVLFHLYPEAVFPVWMEVPIAILLGWFIYKRSKNLVFSTMAAVVLMYVTVVLGHYLPLKMPGIGSVPATGVWTVILLIYAYIASTLPVTTLLQPRDYINAWQLFIAMGLLIIGIFVSAPEMVAPAYNPDPAGAPDFMPFLFITIACGAISGFHSLVSSGTSAKQVSSERDAQFVGYGSMLTESALAVLVIIACAAGIGIAYVTQEGTLLSGTEAWNHHYASWATVTQGLGSKLEAFVIGSANMIASYGIPKEIGIVIIGVFIASFAGTTLDSATRIQRYVISELGNDLKIPAITNRYTATAIAVVTAAALAFFNGAGGKGAMVLWPLFGTINQLLAGLSLLVVSFYLKRRGSNYFLTLVPAFFVILLTGWAMIHNLIVFYETRNTTCLIIGGLACLLEIWMLVEALFLFKRPALAGEGQAP